MKKGFTLIELLVVIGIISILMAVLVSGFKNAPEKAELAKCQELVKNTETALVALFDETVPERKTVFLRGLYGEVVVALDMHELYPAVKRAQHGEADVAVHAHGRDAEHPDHRLPRVASVEYVVLPAVVVSVQKAADPRVFHHLLVDSERPGRMVGAD